MSHLITLVAFNLRISSTFGRETYFGWSFSFLVWFLNLMSLFRCCLMITLVALKFQIVFCFDRESYFGWSFDFLFWCLFWCCLMITRVAFNSLIVFHFWKRIFWFWCCLMITLVAFKSQIVFLFWQRICVVMKLWFISLMSLLMVLVSYAAGNTQDSCNIFSAPIPIPPQSEI